MQDKNQNPQEVTPQNDIGTFDRPKVVKGMVSVKKEDIQSGDTVYIIIELDKSWPTDNSVKITKFEFGGTPYSHDVTTTPMHCSMANEHYISFKIVDSQFIFRHILNPSRGPWSVYFNDGTHESENFVTFTYE